MMIEGFNPLTTNVPIIETSQLICRANQLSGFYMMGTLVVKRLNVEGYYEFSSSCEFD